MRLTSSLISIIAAAIAVTACSQEGVVGSLGNKTGEIAVTDNTLAAIGNGTCVRTGGSEARCWGDNRWGELGIGDSKVGASAEPLMPVNLDGVKALFGGEQAACSLRINGELACWGRVGVANTAEVRFIREEFSVSNPFAMARAIGDVASVAVGRFYFCTLTTAGEVRCFGRNDKGQLGLGDTVDQINPTTVKGFDGPVTSIRASMGGAYTCAVTKSGAVYCWGELPAGIVGADPGIAVTPLRVEGFEEAAVEVVAGAAHACARLVSGKVACWGYGLTGEIGNGRGESTSTPVLANITDVVGLAAGRSHTCAIRSEGSVFCWGADKLGQAGQTGRNTLPSIVVESTFKTRDVACGLEHSCAWGEGGRVVCWGSNEHSQLGPKQATF